MTKIDKHILDNGMVILGEYMPDVTSAAFNFLILAGPALIPEGSVGATNIISDWIFRGAGDRSSVEVTTELDNLGLHRSTSVSSYHLTIGAAMEASNLLEALDIYSDIILRPQLNEDEFVNSKQLAIDNILGLDDDPRQNVMLKLKEQFLDDPIGRPTTGRLDDIKNLSPEKTGEIINSKFDMSNTIFSVAGDYDFDKVCSKIEKLFDTRTKREAAEIETKPAPRGYKHLEKEGAQVHIGMMTDSVPLGDPDYYNVRAAVSVLSGGMSARLFTEVREKRGLCYAVGAKYHTTKNKAGISCYAGTTPDKAQQTYDVIKKEFDILSEDISNEEIERGKAGLKSSLIMSSESSRSRAASIAGDYFLLNRVRKLEEIKEKIEGVTRESVLDFLRKNKFEDFTVVTIGSKKINIK